MARFCRAGLRFPSMGSGAEFLSFVMGLVVLWSGVGLSAQQEPPAPEEPIHTLHVYTNLIQIPTLVLGPNRERLTKPIAESRFSVSIDSGPKFRATHVRLEGDDAISLSILLDVSGDASNLLPKIDDAIADLAPLSLHPKDHISIYVLDCSLLRSLNDVPAGSTELKVGVDNALESWTIRHQKRHGPNCQQSIHLWDALAHVTSELYKLPGRRVILAVSQGDDAGSRHSWNEVRIYAQATGVAVFGLSYLPEYASDLNHRSLRWSSEDPFRSLCELSGGIIFLTNTRSPLTQMLKQFVTTVRGRYIVEFPRPANSTAGEHSMEITIEKGQGDFIRSAGISVPIPDAALLADPTTVPSDPLLTPEQGTRKMMKKPQ
jgi:hypothetical protein